MFFLMQKMHENIDINKSVIIIINFNYSIKKYGFGAK